VLSLIICGVIGVLAVANFSESGEQVGKQVIYLVICMCIGLAWSIIPFSVAAIIRAINANTKELRSIRYAIAKFFSEKKVKQQDQS
jgi:hypothetical protein